MNFYLKDSLNTRRPTNGFPLLQTFIGIFLISKVSSHHTVFNVHIFWEGHKILRNLHCTFDWHYIGQIYGEDFTKFCCLLRIYELYRSRSLCSSVIILWQISFDHRKSKERCITILAPLPILNDDHLCSSTYYQLKSISNYRWVLEKMINNDSNSIYFT